MSGPAVTQALQATLSAEYAAIFGYGVAGAHLAGTQFAAAQRDWAAHEAARDTVTALLAAHGAQPAAAAAAYGLPFPVHNGREAMALAAFLEDRVAAAYLSLVALDDPQLRAFGATGLQAAATRAAGWRGTTLAFPGLEVAPTP
ncbi:MAG TPA: ferritin-like domain-containing protein [Streptosporangiaceae bacterium]|nr:ferritin-like domain-containing protein [Streptosporangiaceae bacterium]